MGESGWHHHLVKNVRLLLLFFPFSSWNIWAWLRGQLAADRLLLKGAVIAAGTVWGNVLINHLGKDCSFRTRAYLWRLQPGKSSVAVDYDKQEEEPGLPNASVHVALWRLPGRWKCFPGGFQICIYRENPSAHQSTMPSITEMPHTSRYCPKDICHTARICGWCQRRYIKTTHIHSLEMSCNFIVCVYFNLLKSRAIKRFLGISFTQFS